jgi:hypothetical protein
MAQQSMLLVGSTGKFIVPQVWFQSCSYPSPTVSRSTIDSSAHWGFVYCGLGRYAKQDDGTVKRKLLMLVEARDDGYVLISNRRNIAQPMELN